MGRPKRKTKSKQPKSVYTKGIQRLIKTAYRKKMSSRDAAARINKSPLAERLGVSFTYRQIATTYGNITRKRCGWYYS